MTTRPPSARSTGFPTTASPSRSPTSSVPSSSWSNASPGGLTRARAAGAGALTGLWGGLLIGTLLGLFTTGHFWLGVVVAAAGFGALWGAVFGFAAHSARRGQRDFSSVRALTARHYDLIARDGLVDRARTMLGAAGLLPAAA